MKEVFAPHLGHNVKFGRKRPVARCPRMSLARYLTTTLPTPPASTSYRGVAAKSLSQMYLNDQLGDCVVAGGYHVVGLETANATGSDFVATSAQITKDYSAIGGYVPGKPATDQGCDEQTALNYWTQHGFANGTKLLGWLAIDASNTTLVKQAMYLFENLFFGIELPDAWVSKMPGASGFTWDVAGAPDPDNGHCIVGVDVSPSGIIIDTWGLTGTLTYKAVQKYADETGQGELYVMLTPDQLQKGQLKAPNGVLWADLIADFDSIGGSVPVPVPPAPQPTPPVPVPIPPTPQAPTLAQAQAWAAAGLAASWPKAR